MKTRDLLEWLLLGALWGASFLFMRVASPEFGPVALIAMRVTAAAMFLVIPILLRKELALIPNYSRNAQLISLSFPRHFRPI